MINPIQSLLKNHIPRRRRSHGRNAAQPLITPGAVAELLENRRLLTTTAFSESEPNDSFGSADFLGVLETDGDTRRVSGQMSVERGTGNSTIGQRRRIPEEDYFRFQIDTAAQFQILASVSTVAHSPSVTLYRSDQSAIATLSLTSTANFTTEQNLSPGNYYVGLTGLENQSASNVEPSYTIDVRRVSSQNGGGGAGGSAAEVEPNDTFATAMNLEAIGVAIGSELAVAGSIAVDRPAGNSRIAELTRIPESDIFRFEVTQVGNFRGAATVDRVVQSPKISLFNSNGDILAADVFGGNREAAIENNLAVGVYYLEVTGDRNTSGSDVEPNYDITISRLSSSTAGTRDAEPNGTLETAVDLGVLSNRIDVSGTLEVNRSGGNSRVGQLLRIPGADFYEFEVTDSRDVRFSVGLDRVQHNPVIRLYEKDSEDLLESRRISATTGTSWIEYLSPGSYVFVITGQQNTSGSDVAPRYTVTLDPLAVSTPGTFIDQEDNDNFSTANNLGTITESLSVTGRLEVVAGSGNSTIGQRVRIPDNDYFRFSVDGDQEFRFSTELDRVAHSPTLTVHSADQSVIVTELITTALGTSLQAQLTSGDYFLSITAPQNNSGVDVEPNYTLQIDVLDAAESLPIGGVELEPNDVLSSANQLGTISEFTAVTGVLSVKNGPGNSPIGQRVRQPNPDFFHFVVDNEGEFTVGLSLGRFEHDPVLTLYGSSRQMISTESLTDAAGVIIRETLAAGEYYVSITAPTNSAGSDAEPTYLLTIDPTADDQTTGVPIDGVEIERNDSFATANQIGLVDEFKSIQGGIHTTRPAGNSHVADVVSFANPDFFSFQVDQAGEFSLTLTADRLPFPFTVSLVNDAREVIVSERMANTRRATLTSNLQPGNYFVLIYGPNAVTGVNATPNYTLIIEPPRANLPPDRFEPASDVPETAPSFSESQIVSGLSIHSFTDFDYYQVTLSSAGRSTDFVRLNHSIVSTSADLDLFLADTDGNVLDQAATTDPLEIISLEGVAAGEYFVFVIGYEGSIAAYDLQLNLPQGTTAGEIVPDRFESNDDFANATPLQSIEGLVSITDLTVHVDTVDAVSTPNTDFYSFYLLNEANSAHSVSLLASATSDFPILSLHDESGNVISSTTEADVTPTLSLDGLNAGEYTVAVTSADAAGFAYELSFETPYRESGFDITYEIQGGNPVGLEEALVAAISRWEEVIVGDLPEVRLAGDLSSEEALTERLFDQPFDLPENGVVDDLHIVVRVGTEDGLGRILASAIELVQRPDGQTVLGAVKVDSSDVVDALDAGTLVGTLVHEIGHILARPNYWRREGFIGFDTDGIVGFTGESSLAEYRTLSLNPSQSVVPVQPTGDSDRPWGGHWDEEIFQTELMTPFTDLTSFEPLSALTIAQLQDLGYVVNFSAADPYTLPPESNVQSQNSLSNAQTVDGSGHDHNHDSILTTADLTILSEQSLSQIVSSDLDTLFPVDFRTSELSRSQSRDGIHARPGESHEFTFTLAAIGTEDHRFSVFGFPDTPINVTLLDGDGSILSTGQTQSGANTNNQMVSLAGYPAGDYVVRITNDAYNIYSFDFVGQFESGPSQLAPADIDGSGHTPDQFTDGVLMLGYLGGLRSAAQIQPLLGGGATLAEAQVVVDRLNELTSGTNPAFDVDQSGGTVDQFTDGILLLAYFSGLRQTAQIAPLVVAPPATIEATAIKANIDALFALPGTERSTEDSLLFSAPAITPIVPAAATQQEVAADLRNLQSTNEPPLVHHASPKLTPRIALSEAIRVNNSAPQTPVVDEGDFYFASLLDDEDRLLFW